MADRLEMLSVEQLNNAVSLVNAVSSQGKVNATTSIAQCLSIPHGKGLSCYLILIYGCCKHNLTCENMHISTMIVAVFKRLSMARCKVLISVQ